MNERSSHKSAPPPAPAPSSSGSSLTGKSSSGSEGSGPVAGSDGQMTIISSRQPVPRLPIGREDSPLETRGLLEGEQLGQFLLEKFVGGGGMGVVFRALDTTLNRQVAVKVLSRDQSADEETLRRFRNEAQSAARLNHENIARVHYVGEDRGVHYIVFEFIEGVNIRDLVERNGPLPLDDAISFTYQIAQALEHASQRAVIHRDIKPSNVLITPDGKAKLVDMGLARLNQVAQADNDLTASGVTLGTFDYISPEQARDPRSADVRSDLYSLGCSFFYMLTGRPPFPDGTVLQKLLQHQADHPPDPRGVRPELPSDVARILARLLSKNPAHRYQQPEELSSELVALGDKLGIQLNSSRSNYAPARTLGPLSGWQRHLPWAVPLVALFLIVIGLDFYWSAEPPAVVGPVQLPAATVRIPRPQPIGPTTDSQPPGSQPAVQPSDSDRIASRRTGHARLLAARDRPLWNRQPRTIASQDVGGGQPRRAEFAGHCPSSRRHRCAACEHGVAAGVRAKRSARGAGECADRGRGVQWRACLCQPACSLQRRQEWRCHRASLRWPSTGTADRDLEHQAHDSRRRSLSARRGLST
jgi:serine/threonine protein kinase